MTVSPAVSSPILILGAGSWGTALALHLSRNQQPVRLWGIVEDEMSAMIKARVNHRYLPNYAFPPLLQPVINLEEAMQDVVDILIAVPSHGFASTLTLLRPFLLPTMRIAWATKGLDPETGSLLGVVAERYLPSNTPLAVVAGPSFANEVAAGLPTAVTVASQDITFAQDLIKRFHSVTFRPYYNSDMIGVQLCGAVKNPVAVATGISDGLGFGANARCALITRALVEMTRLGLAMGGRAETFNGLAGLGDLVLTCTDNQSRNRRFGVAVGQGKSFDEAAEIVGQVVEGRSNAGLVRNLARQHQVSMPIIECVCNVLDGVIASRDAVQALLSREIKSES